jgi:DNA-directed RNA polymerase subunit RPC12/RpoP
MGISEEAVKDKANALRNLVSFKDKTEEEILDKARELLEKDHYDIDVGIMFTDKKEMKHARMLLGKYLDDYSIETISDKNTLREVIYLEIVQQRLQEKLNEFYAGDGKAVPLQLVELIHKNSDAILKLKFSLGLSKEKETKKSGLDVLAELRKRFAIWRSENQGTRTLTCPHCGKMVMLKIRTDAWKAQKHPFFRDRILTNKHLLELYKKGTITKKDVAKILECATDYVDWIIEKSQAPEDEKKQVEQAVPKGQAAQEEQASTSVASVAEGRSEGEDAMHMSKEKMARENRCPECTTGYLSCRMTTDGTGQWEEHCTSCEYHKIHICRRQKVVPIDFPDRRNNNGVTPDLK